MSRLTLAKLLPKLNCKYLYRFYAICPCQKPGGICNCGPDSDCSCCKQLKRVGPTGDRDLEEGYEPSTLSTTAFEIPEYIKPKVFRPIVGNAVLGPNADKCECYKNPEYFSYHKYSHYDLQMSTNEVKDSDKHDE